MRYPSDHKAGTHKRLLKAASREIRMKGPDGVSVGGLMAHLGLTHGGFYAHFGSKDDLVTAAIDAMFDDSRRKFVRVTAVGTPREKLRAYITMYLDPQHRDSRDRGCPLPSLSADIARRQGVGHSRFGEGIASLTDRLATLLEEGGYENASELAASTLAEMVGAVVLSRAVADPAHSDAIISTTRRALLSRFNLGEC